MKSIKHLQLATVATLFCATATSWAVNNSHPVTVIDSTNDGSIPAGCQVVNNNPGGVAEVSLDLDEDGVADLCLGSGSDNCDTGINFDCSSGAGGGLCSAQTNVSSQLMDGNLSASFNQGTSVGPFFTATADSVDGVPGDTALVIGFSDSSVNPSLMGYFELSYDANNCEYDFGSAYFDDGDNSVRFGDVPEFVVNSTGDAADATPDGICDTGAVRGGAAECTLRAAIAEGNLISGNKHILFDIADGGCGAGVCTINVDTVNNGFLPDITSPVVIDGTSQPGSENLCDLAIADRGSYGVVLQGDANDIGLRLANGSSGSTIKGLNIRNFFNNLAIIDSDDNHIQCNFIGTDETGMLGAGNNAASGIIVGCDSQGNVIGGPSSQDGNLIANNNVDGIQFFAGFTCTPPGSLPHNNAILGNYIGSTKDAQSPLGNTFSGISFFGGAAFDNFIGVLQDGSTINGNVIVDSESGIYLDDGTQNTLILGNFLGTDPTGMVNLGNVFGGVDIINGSDNQVGGPGLGEGNVIANNSEGVFITGLSSAGNQVRGNTSFDNLTVAIDLIQDGGINPDGLNVNDSDDADTGANLLMNHPEASSAVLLNASGALIVDVTLSVDATDTNAAYPLQIDAYLDESTATGQGATFVVGDIYSTPQAIAIISFDVPDGITGGFLRFTATDANGNTSELSEAIQFGIIDLIFADGFD